MPWDVTDQYIRSGHGPKQKTCRTISISARKGIKAIYCRQPTDGWAIQSYLFSRAKGWTMSKAKAWFQAHQETFNPLHPDFRKMRQAMIKQHGTKKGNQVFWARVNKCSYDETKPIAGQTCKAEGLNYEIHPDFAPIFYGLADHYGQDKGVFLYNRWLQDNRFDDANPLNAQLGKVWESFDWVPIQFVKEEEDGAKLYKVKCVHVGISVNRNKYNLEELKAAARSLAKKRLNINHNHNQRLTYPENRVTKYVNFEDYWVEAIIRVKDPTVQKLIDLGIIKYPSIEWDAWDTKIKPADGIIYEPQGLMFDELALLTDVKHPGILPSSIKPFSEAVKYSQFSTFPSSLGEAVLLESIISRSSEGQTRQKEEKTTTQQSQGGTLDLTKLMPQEQEICNPDGSINDVHLRAALRRLPQTKISDALKAKALAHLRRHAKAAGIGEEEVQRLLLGIEEGDLMELSIELKTLWEASEQIPEQPAKAAQPAQRPIEDRLAYVERRQESDFRCLNRSIKVTNARINVIDAKLETMLRMMRVEKTRATLNRVARRLSQIEAKLKKGFRGAS